MDDLKKLRQKMDELDDQLAALLRQRIEVARQIGCFKQEGNLPIIDIQREEEVLTRVAIAAENSIVKEGIVEIYSEIIKQARLIQQFYNQASFPFDRVGIAGTGLMGGSLCKAIKARNPSAEINALAYPSKDQELALYEGSIDRVWESLEEWVHSSELLILATPISAVVPLAESIKAARNQACHRLYVMDIASVKKEIVSVFEELTNDDVEFIGTHPLAGKETPGFQASKASLYVDAPWVVVPHRKNSDDGLNLIGQVIRFMGARPFFLTAEMHDAQAALVSHLPGLLSRLFFDFVSHIAPESLKIAGPGFASVTRLARDNSEMRKEIEERNCIFIRQAFQRWIEYLKLMDISKPPLS